MNKKIWIASAAFVLVVAVMVGIFFATRPQTQEGKKTVTISIIHKDKKETEIICDTEEEYLAGLMVYNGLIPEGNIVNGMFDTVDGETAVWAEDEGWWAIYIGEEMASLGINEIPVTNGGEYRFVYTNGYAS